MNELLKFYNEELEKKKTTSSKKAFLTKSEKQTEEHLKDLEEHKISGWLYGERVTNTRIARVKAELKLIMDFKQKIDTDVSKSINATISKKYNIGRYGNVGHEVQDNGKRVFVSNSAKNDYTNWLLAVDFAKKYFKQKSSIKNQSVMPTKKPSAKQLAARKKFAEMAKSGELAKKRATTAKKNPGLKKPVTKGLTTLCAETVGAVGRRKKDGTIKKGHVAKKGGKVVPVKKKATTKKK